MAPRILRKLLYFLAHLRDPNSSWSLQTSRQSLTTLSNSDWLSSNWSLVDISLCTSGEGQGLDSNAKGKKLVHVCLKGRIKIRPTLNPL